MSLLTVSMDAPPEPIRAEADGGAPAAATTPEPRSRKRLLLAVLAIAAVLAAAVGSAVLVTAAFVSAAEDIGRGMSEGLGSVRNSLVLERSATVAPGDLGADPVLDGYARSCFDGDLQACDDLAAESAPTSSYAQYAATCGGRVGPDAVSACTDLE